MDGLVTVFDLDSMSMMQQIPNTRGVTSFSINESTSVLVAAGKRKVDILIWTEKGLVHRREISLSESPRAVECLKSGTGAIVGYKRSYEYVDLMPTATHNGLKVMDVGREHRMMILELPPLKLRSACILVSNGIQGALVDLHQYEPGHTVAPPPRSDERLEWTAAPISVHLCMPYIISLQADGIEVHDVVTLSSLQRIRLTPITNATCMWTCEVGENREYFYAFSPDQLNAFKMVPLAAQVDSLLQGGMYQDAINVCAACRSPRLDAELAAYNIHVPEIHHQFANALHAKGDFEGAINNFIPARTKASDVIALFPDFISASLYAAFSSCTEGITLPPRTAANTRLSGTVLHRAAAALVLFCEYHRPKLRGYIDRLEAVDLERGNFSSSGSNRRTTIEQEDENSDDGYSQSSYSDSRGITHQRRTESSSASATMSLAEAQAVAVLVDTVYLSALVNCSPARRGGVLDLLTELPPVQPNSASSSQNSSSHSTSVTSRRKLTGSIGYNRDFGNQCHVESCAVVLASQGSAFTEPLLWLYRSHAEHKKALGYLTEDRCVISGSGKSGTVGWNIHQFYQWTRDYLQWLWFNEGDKGATALAPLVLPSLKQVLKFDADLGMSVLVLRPKGMRGAGGKGVSVHEVISCLEAISPGPSKNSLQIIAAIAEDHEADGVTDYAHLLPIPLVNGRALAIAYLEFLIATINTVPVPVQDEFAQLLMESIPMQLTVNHDSNDLKLRQTDDNMLTTYKLYRLKLQAFLKDPRSDFSTKKIAKAIPQELQHEYALILSKMGRHDETLRIYCHHLADITSAEEYCHRLFDQAVKGVYMKLILTLISPPEDSILLSLERGSMNGNDDAVRLLHYAVSVAERNFDRVDSTEFLHALPKSIPIAMLTKYLNLIFESGNAKKRNLQVVHQLLRIQEVNLRTSSPTNSNIV